MAIRVEDIVDEDKFWATVGNPQGTRDELPEAVLKVLKQQAQAEIARLKQAHPTEIGRDGMEEQFATNRAEQILFAQYDRNPAVLKEWKAEQAAGEKGKLDAKNFKGAKVHPRLGGGHETGSGRGA
ncbi:MAG: hypothetical protein ACK502_10085 [Alphaproteobacteria bacterium]